ncbi:hypothetical protein OH77DRAFT_1270538 [Trametes cingulata]|nr:hypothetical protein OH77DRAFT_1269958 [Trametes cingulata]KAI0349405.1 hypothetical protein OH77DRAFT_1270538 [Trametes cingulata]
MPSCSSVRPQREAGRTHAAVPTLHITARRPSRAPDADAQLAYGSQPTQHSASDLPPSSSTSSSRSTVPPAMHNMWPPLQPHHIPERSLAIHDIPAHPPPYLMPSLSSIFGRVSLSSAGPPPPTSHVGPFSRRPRQY